MIIKIDKLTFRKDSQGRNVYFPLGTGKGYVMPDTKVESQIKSYLKFRSILIFGSTLPIVFTWGHLELIHIVYLAIILIGINLAVWFAGNLIFFRNLEVITDQANKEILSKQIREPESFPKLILLLLASLAFVIAGILVYSRGQTGMGIACISFFGLGIVISVFQIISKIKRK